MKKLRKFTAVFCAVLSVLLMLQAGAFAATSTDFRFPDDFSDSLKKYNALELISSEGAFAVPGAESTDVLGDTCDTMVAQGLCTTDKYILVTAYCGVSSYKSDLKNFSLFGKNKQKLEAQENHTAHKSVVYVLSKKDGTLLKTLVLPDKNHVGGIAFDGKYVWIAKSSDKKLSALTTQQIDLALEEKRMSVDVKYYKSVDCGCTASFVTYYDGLIWVGVFNETEKSVINGFVLSENEMTLTKTAELPLPKKANGATFFEVGGKDYLAVNSSYGRDKDTEMYLYAVNADFTGISKEYKPLTLPPLAEEICVDGGRTYVIFESVSSLYSTVDMHKCTAVVDRICIGDAEELADYAEKTENCNHLCHKTGFMGFIYKIFSFFWKLFGINKVCDCGIAHF